MRYRPTPLPRADFPGVRAPAGVLPLDLLLPFISISSFPTRHYLASRTVFFRDSAFVTLRRSSPVRCLESCFRSTSRTTRREVREKRLHSLRSARKCTRLPDLSAPIYGELRRAASSNSTSNRLPLLFFQLSDKTNSCVSLLRVVLGNVSFGPVCQYMLPFDAAP